jgi:hypothetical protein
MGFMCDIQMSLGKVADMNDRRQKYFSGHFSNLDTKAVFKFGYKGI